MEIILSKHAQDLLAERNISEEWVWRTIKEPDRHDLGADKNVHYFKSINEFENRILHVVINSNVSPKKVVTIFFDRRERNKK